MKVDDAGSNCLATEVARATEVDLPNRSPASLSSWTFRYFCETWSVLFRKLEIEFPMVSAGILICHGQMARLFLHSFGRITLNNTIRDT